MLDRLGIVLTLRYIRCIAVREMQVCRGNGQLPAGHYSYKLRTHDYANLTRHYKFSDLFLVSVACEAGIDFSAYI